MKRDRTRRDRIVAMYQAGATANEIAEKEGISAAGVRKSLTYACALPADRRPSPNKVETPKGFAEIVPLLTIEQLEERFGLKRGVIYRMCRENGLLPARKPMKRRVSYRPWGAPPKALDPVNHDGSRAALAAEFLRRWAPVYRCDAEGHQLQDGFFWRHGRQVRTDDELIERATAKGWNPDAWREVRAA